MYTVSVRGHMMIAHSFRGELFGPAQRLHGATYVVDVEFQRPDLGEEGVVVDIGRASTAVGAVLHELDFKNLDEDPAFTGKNTTTEFLAKIVFERVCARIQAGELGPGAERLVGMKVTLHESHIASASYTGELRLALGGDARG
jgi:6-pyruvoyl-tetrahydropterin synthase